MAFRFVMPATAASWTKDGEEDNNKKGKIKIIYKSKNSFGKIPAGGNKYNCRANTHLFHFG